MNPDQYTTAIPHEPEPRELPNTWNVYAFSTRRLKADAGTIVGQQSVPATDETFKVFETPVERSDDRHVITGTLAGKLNDAVERAKDYLAAEGRCGLWELRALRIPALYLEAMWLHSKSGLSDVVVPYSSYDEDILESQVYRLATFLELAARAVPSCGRQDP